MNYAPLELKQWLTNTTISWLLHYCDWKKLSVNCVFHHEVNAFKEKFVRYGLKPDVPLRL